LLDSQLSNRCNDEGTRYNINKRGTNKQDGTSRRAQKNPYSRGKATASQFQPSDLINEHDLGVLGRAFNRTASER